MSFLSTLSFFMYTDEQTFLIVFFALPSSSWPLVIAELSGVFLCHDQKKKNSWLELYSYSYYYYYSVYSVYKIQY